MDLQNLREHHEGLLFFMENNGYSSTYIQRFRDEINHILADADSSRWQSYRDIYLEYLKVPHSKDYLRNKRTIIGALEQFDLFGRLPDGRHRHTLFERGSYHLLEPEFQELIDFYRIYEKQRGKKESTIRGEALNTASFLYQMQGQGAQCLDEVTEDAVLSFFVSEDGSLLKGCSYKKNISAVFKAGLNWKEPQCQRILSFLPLLRETRKTIQYLTQDEIRLLRAAVESSGFSARNRAIILLLLFTGLRHCRPYIQLHRLGKRADTGGTAENIRASRDPAFCCRGKCHIWLSGTGKTGYRILKPVPDGNASFFTHFRPGHRKYRVKSLQAGRDKADPRGQGGHPYLQAQPGILHAGERRPPARDHTDAGAYGPGFP